MNLLPIFLVEIGHRPNLGRLLGFLLAMLCCVTLNYAGAFASLGSPTYRMAFSFGALVPFSFFFVGIFEAFGAAYVPDGKKSGDRIIYGLASAVSALGILIPGALYIWM